MRLGRRAIFGGAAAWPAAGAALPPALSGGKVFRCALNIAETGFDPPRVPDQSSIRVLAHIFEAPLAWDVLAQPARLVELYGCVDRNRDGWREQPDGRPLELRIAFPPDQRSRRLSELWLKRMNAVGLRVRFDVAPFGELIRKSLAGQLMMWGFAWSAGAPDGDFFLGLACGPNAEQSNDARFRLAAFDRLYEGQRMLPVGPIRHRRWHAVFRTATRVPAKDAGRLQQRGKRGN